MTQNKSTEILTFEQFVRLVAAPGSPHQNAHWRPASKHCGLVKYGSKYNFVGNFEHLQPHAELLLKGTDLWESFGKTGWGGGNYSMFQTNKVSRCVDFGKIKLTLAFFGGVRQPIVRAMGLS